MTDLRGRCQDVAMEALRTASVGRHETEQGGSPQVTVVEAVGFEPTRPEGPLVFKTSAFVRSATPPWLRSLGPDRALGRGSRGPRAVVTLPIAPAGAREASHSPV